MKYYKGWYRSERDGPPPDTRYSEWVVYALDEEEAKAKIMRSIGRDEPDRGYRVYTISIDDEDEGTVAFASARQSGQAL